MGVFYTPNIYIPNIETQNPDLEPIIAVGSELYDYDEDIIIGWNYTISGEQELIYLTEEDAMQNEQPIFIINAVPIENDTIGKMNKPVYHNTGSKMLNTKHNTISATIDEYKISERYETSKYSEYSYEMCWLIDGGGIEFSGYRTEIREIHKDDINHLFTNDFEIWQLDWLNNIVEVGLVTFEYDRYAPKHPIMTDMGVPVSCRMRRSHEWYQNLTFPLIENTIVEENTKGKIKIKPELSNRRFIKSNYCFYEGNPDLDFV
jgi:hypothetical protein